MLITLLQIEKEALLFEETAEAGAGGPVARHHPHPAEPRRRPHDLVRQVGVPLDPHAARPYPGSSDRTAVRTAFARVAGVRAFRIGRISR